MVRVTQNLFYASSQRNIAESLQRIYTAQQEISSGRRIRKPSDDAGAIGRLLSLKRSQDDLAQYASNASQGRTFVESAASSLQDASDLVVSARESVIQALNGSLSSVDRATLAEEIDGVVRDLVALANSRVGSRFLFSGTATERAPFELVTDAEGRDRVVYHGNSDAILAEIGPDQTAAMNLPGSRVFSTGTRGATVFEGLTGVASAAIGSDSGTGLDTLTLSHVSTVWVGGGVQPGASSPAGDTILGSGHVLQLSVDPSGTSGTVALNGGEPVPFTDQDADLRVEGENGEVVFVDMRTVSAGFQGSVAAFTSGTMSLDGGATTTPIQFTAQQRVFDSRTGAVLNVDTSGVRRSGDESVSYPGTYDLFSSLLAIRDELRDVGSQGDASSDLRGVNRLLEELDGAHERLLRGLGTLGGIAGRLEASEARLEDTRTTVRGLVSDIEDVDLAEAVSRLERDETAYQGTLLVTSRLDRLSLLNYL